jgi:50S ribosomal protein L16 3-hydroxylase
MMFSTNFEQFSQKYWMKSPVLYKHCFNPEDLDLSVQDLITIAKEQELTHRLIQYQAPNYQLIEDPSSKQVLDSNKPLTYFVQNMDWVFEELYQIKKSLSFLPDWRFDDIMASYSTPGGSAGPHLDYYDVFILQIRGSKIWKVENSSRTFEQAEGENLQKNSDIKLVKTLGPHREFLLGPGDLLYVPTQFAHHALATDEDSFSYSVGLRAPRMNSIIEQLDASFCRPDQDDWRMQEQLRYRNRFEIPSDLFQWILDWPKGLPPHGHSIARWFGSLVTEQEFDQEIIDWSPGGTPINIENDQLFERDLSTRLAFAQEKDQLYFFINGQRIDLEIELLDFIEFICQHEKFHARDLTPYHTHPHALSLLTYLCKMDYWRGHNDLV